MKNLIGKCKSLIACAIAFAVVAVSLFTGVLVTASAETVGTCGRTIVEKWDGYENGRYVNWYSENNQTYEGVGTKASPFIIDTAEKLAKLCRYGCEANVYYKVADDIRAFDMNTVSGVDLTVDNISATDVKNAVADKILGKVWFCDAPFKGNFDGNGVTIYGLCTGPAYYNQSSFENGLKAGHNRGGLFPKIDAKTAVIKNVAVKNSYFKGDPAGAIFGETLGNGGSAIIENIIVANCYVDSSGGYISGVVGGYCLYDATTNTADKVKLNNCLVYDNVLFNKDGTPARLIGTMEAYCDNGSGGKKQDIDGFKTSNTIAIGCQIEKSDSYWQKNAKYFTNCYTTENCATENTTITKLASANDAKGSATLNTLKSLNADDWFFNTTTYPEPIVFHDIKTQDNGDGTHVASCGCGLSSLAVAHVYENGVCSCGVAAKCGEIASVYSGTPDTSLEGAGTVTNPYLVKTADEFAAVALGKIASTENTYFKVDGIDAFYMNGGVEVANMTSAEQVKTYFSTTSSLKNWVSSGPFIGQFDGNGITVYGLYAKHTGQYDQAALFPKVSGHSSIKNIAIKNSYISSYNKDGSIAALVGGTIWSGDSNADTSITLENIMVANNYIASTNDTVKTGASVLMGCFFEKHYAIVNNCLIYGNVVENAYTGAGLKSAMITTYNGTGATTKFNNIVSIGVTPWSVVDNKDGTYGSANWYISNIDSGHYTNIYTDQSIDPLQAYNPVNNADKYLEKFNINSLPISDMEGSLAVENLNTLGDAWIFSAIGYPELRVFHDDELDMEYAADNYAGHIESCSCGFITPVVEHDYNDNYKCIDCGFVCDHANADVDISGGDCLTAATKTVICSCGYENASPNGTATGHAFIYKNEVPSENCLTQGTAAHKYCAVCDKKYAADADVLAAYNTALTDEELKLPVANHTPTTDDSGIIYDANDANHSKICSVCQEKFDTESHVGSFVADGANGHKGQCSVCMLDTSTEAAPHNFVGSTCEDCNWTCNNHNFVEGNVKNEGDCTNDRVVATLCSICKIAGTDKITTALGHVNGEIKNENIVAPDCDDDGSHDEVVYCTECEKELSRVNVTDVAPGHIAGSSWEENHISDCINGDSYELVTQCSVCFAEASREVVNLEATGHDILDYEELAPNCVDEGWIAHSQCNNCGEHFAFGTSDKFSEEYINSEDIYIDADPDAHKWVEVEAVDADCENGGTIGYKYCKYCALFVAGETQLEIEIDFDALWDELDPIMTEEYEKTWETFTAAYPEPGEDATDEEWNEFNDAFLEVWNPVSESIYDAAYQDAIIEAAKAESVEFETEAKGHTITYVEAVAATYDSEGTKAHYACECGKLYSDAEGKNEITAESLVIEKLVKEDDATSDKPAGDTSDTSPETDDTIVSLLAFTSLLGAAFIATKKFRNK